MFRRFQAWEAKINRSSPARMPVFGSIDQALADAGAEADASKDALLTAEQDLGNKHHEINVCRGRFETAEKELLRRDRSEKTRGRSLGRSDDEDEDSYSFSRRTSRGFGHSRKELFNTRSPSLVTPGLRLLQEAIGLALFS